MITSILYPSKEVFRWKPKEPSSLSKTDERSLLKRKKKEVSTMLFVTQPDYLPRIPRDDECGSGSIVDEVFRIVDGMILY